MNLLALIAVPALIALALGWANERVAEVERLGGEMARLVEASRKAQIGVSVKIDVEKWQFVACDLCSGCIVRERHHQVDVPCGATLAGFAGGCRGTIRLLPNQEVLFAAFDLGGWAGVEAVADDVMFGQRLRNAKEFVERGRS